MKNFDAAQRHFEKRRDFEIAEIAESEEIIEECPCCGGEVESVTGMIFCVESETCEWMVGK